MTPDQPTIDRLAAAPVAEGRLLIDGQWVAGSDPETPVLSPVDGRQLTTLASASATDVARACANARAAFDDGRWSRLPPRPQGRAAPPGRPDRCPCAGPGRPGRARQRDRDFDGAEGRTRSAAQTFRYYAEALDKVYGEIAPTAPGTLALIHREPVGVVGAIVPGTSPDDRRLEDRPRAGHGQFRRPETGRNRLAHAPPPCRPGAGGGRSPRRLQRRHRPRARDREALALSPDVDVLVFTGSGATGRRLLEYSARSNLKRCYLELGGKSPNIVFADAPTCSRRKGRRHRHLPQRRASLRRRIAPLVEASVHDEFVSIVAETARRMAVGNPLSTLHPGRRRQLPPPA